MSAWPEKVEVYPGADAGAATLGTLVPAGKQFRVNTDVVWANEPLMVFANNDIIRSVVGPHGGFFKTVSDASLIESGGYSDQKALVAYSRADVAGEPDGNHIYLKTASNSGAHFAKTDIETIAVTTGDAGQFVASVTVQSENLTNVSEIVAATNSTSGTSLQLIWQGAGTTDCEINLQTVITSGLSLALTGYKAQGFDHAFRINDEDGIVTRFSPFVADGATAVGYLFDTSNALANNASRIAQFSNNGIIQLAVTPFGGLFRAVSAASEALWGGFTDQDALVSISRADIAGEPDAHIIQLAATSDNWLYAGHVFVDANAASTGAAGSYNAQVQLSANNATKTIEIQSRIGTEVGAFINMLSIKAQSEAYNFRISDEDGVVTLFSPMVADGASAIGYTFDTSNALSNATSRLSSWRNNGAEQVAFCKHGGISVGSNTEATIGFLPNDGSALFCGRDNSLGDPSVNGWSLAMLSATDATYSHVVMDPSNVEFLLRMFDDGTSTNSEWVWNVTDSSVRQQGKILGTTRIDLNPGVLDGATAEAYVFNTSVALANAGARIVSFEITSTRKASIDVNGAYFVGANQVVGARVVDARIDDAINSGDGTTDGVIDACRDALIAHGLCTAA